MAFSSAMMRDDLFDSDVMCSDAGSLSFGSWNFIIATVITSVVPCGNHSMESFLSGEERSVS